VRPQPQLVEVPTVAQRAVVEVPGLIVD